MTGRLRSVAGAVGEVEIAGHVVTVPHRGRAGWRGHRGDPARRDPSRPAGRPAASPARSCRAAFVGRAVEYRIDTPVGELLVIESGMEALHPVGGASA